MISPERWTRVARSNSATTNYGVTATASASANTKGSWAALYSATTFDAYMIGVLVESTGASGTDTPVLVDVGYDAAGGSSYTLLVADILGGATLSVNTGGGREYWFPCYIPSGSSVATRIQSTITSKTAYIGATLLGGVNRSNPLPHRGPVITYGAQNSGASNGVALTDFVTANSKPSTWDEITASTTRDHSGFTVCIQLGDSIVSAGVRYFLDVGVGAAASEQVIIPDMACGVGTAETVNGPFGQIGSLATPVPAGSRIAVRAQASAANAQSDLEVAVYGW